MSAIDRAMIERAIATPEWRATAEALLQATGISISVVDLNACETLFGAEQCSYCRLAIGAFEPGPTTCYDTCPIASAATRRIACRAGLTTHAMAVPMAESIVAHIIAGGFVTSTRERRLLFQQLLSRGVAEDSARLVLKSLPVLTRRQVDAHLSIAVASLQSTTLGVMGRCAAERRAKDLSLLESLNRTTAGVDAIDERVLSGLLEDALSLANSDAGALLVPITGALEVVAVAGDWRGSIGVRVSRENTASGRAASSRRPVLVPGDGASGAGGTLAVPLTGRDRVVGVLELRLAPGIDGIDASVDRLLERLGSLLGTVLERRREMVAVNEAVAENDRLDGTAQALARITDLDHAIRFAIGALEHSFVADVAGVAVTSWGQDRADVVVRGPIGNDELQSIVGQALGRDLGKQPLEELCTRVSGGSIEDAPQLGEDWASLEVEIEAGELLVGYLFLAARQGVAYGADERKTLERLARHVGAALERASLFARIRDDYATTIAALSTTLHAQQHRVPGQRRRVMDWAVLIGEEIGLPVEEREHLRFAGLLHDTGKGGLAEEIVLEPTRVTLADILRLSMHAGMGSTIVDQIDFLKALTPIILHHHESWDGSGYPMGLKGAEIPLLARILAVADAFDELAESAEDAPAAYARACAEIQRQSRKLYDPRVVKALGRVLDRDVLVAGAGLYVPESALGRPDLPA